MTRARPTSGGEPAPPTHVEITAGGLSVIVESALPLPAVAKKALELWHEVAGHPDLTRTTRTGIGFVTCESREVTETPAAYTPPNHLSPGEPYEDRTR